VMYVDLMGLEKTLIIVFNGYSATRYGEVDRKDRWQTSLGENIVNYYDDSVRESFDKSYNSSIDIKQYESGLIFSTVGMARNYVLDNKDKYDKYIIIGHSLGADNAVELANSLDEDNIKINLLLTIDLQAVYDTTTVNDNTLKAVNYYQTNSSSIVNGAELNIDKNNTITNLSNNEINSSCDLYACDYFHQGEKFGHTYLDDKLENQIKSQINNIINY
ncbi:MAG: hypothetical protein PHN31_02460, partial [Candidatus Gracilibacteria bacterium]|nr:hypothetical protein [Candidatus Gracilibacteria bacterium]